MLNRTFLHLFKMQLIKLSNTLNKVKSGFKKMLPPQPKMLKTKLNIWLRRARNMLNRTLLHHCKMLLIKLSNMLNKVKSG